ERLEAEVEEEVRVFVELVPNRVVFKHQPLVDELFVDRFRRETVRLWPWLLSTAARSVRCSERLWKHHLILEKGPQYSGSGGGRVDIEGTVDFAHNHHHR